MVITCVVVGCNNKGKHGSPFRFFSFPNMSSDRFDQKLINLSFERRALWIQSVKRDNWQPTKHSRICSDHFISGRPSDIMDRLNPDWVPSQRLGYGTQQLTATVATARYLRSKKRCQKKQAISNELETVNEMLDGDNGSAAEDPGGSDELSQPNNSGELEETNLRAASPVNVETGIYCQTDLSVAQLQALERIVAELEDKENIIAELISSRDGLESELQDATFEISSLKIDIEQLVAVNTDLQARLETKEREFKVSINEKELQDDENKLKFYTGLINWGVFMVVFNLVKPYLSDSEKLSPFSRIIMFFLKIRLNLFDEDIGYRFGVHSTTVSKNFHKVLYVMARRLRCFIHWPSREELRKTMPFAFKSEFPNCAVIIDCTEIRMEQPSDLRARAQVWSHYKQNSTCKILIAITPQGTISFISDVWGGRVSDKQLTEECGILDLLLPGDVVLADRGFKIDDSVGLYMAEIKYPAFTRGKKQLDAVDVERSRNLARVRIHVERVIGVLKQKYTILESTLSISFLSGSIYDRCPTTDLMIVCSALVNLNPAIVSID